MVRKAVIPAAGWGTRFLPATKVLPKEMVAVVDRPAIHYVVEAAVQAGFKEILIVTGRNKRAIEDYFDQAPELEHYLRSHGKLDLLQKVQESTRLAEISYIRQREARGLGDAVRCARRMVGDEPFAVLLPDELLLSDTHCLRRMAEVHGAEGGAVIAVQPVPGPELHRYGVIRPAANQRPGNVVVVDDMVEKPQVEDAPSNLAAIGRYILPPEIFDILDRLPSERGGEIQLTDALRVLATRGRLKACVYHGARFDVGCRQGFLEANVAMALQRPDLAVQFRRFLAEQLAASAGPAVAPLAGSEREAS